MKKRIDIKQLAGLNVFLMLLLALSACNSPDARYHPIQRTPSIYPSYQGTVIPYNIAPPNFMIREEGTSFVVRFAVAGKDSFDVVCKEKVIIPLRKWKKLLDEHRGEYLEVSIFARQSDGWVRFLPVRFTIAAEPIDSYLVYRLIEPGYEGWGTMGLYQRCVENFDESPIILNTLTDNNCINCHSFCKGNPQTMLFHVRLQHAGTIFIQDNKIRKVNTRKSGMISAGVYPRWHPDGRYVAFSTNITNQSFYASGAHRVEVYDKESDIVIYDTETNTFFTDSLIHSKDRYETYPEWSPDGNYLYYCSAPACQMPQQFDSIRYDLYRISFNPSTRSFGKHIDTLVAAQNIGKSVAFPRVSPDGKQAVFCLSDYGCFPIWHRENDLYQLNLVSGEISIMSAVNSDQSDSYHSWSSNSRWLVFSSRRMDGLFTRPYIAYVDAEGMSHTPFLLPQKNPQYYDYSLKSFNIPELITGKVEVSPYQLAEAIRQ